MVSGSHRSASGFSTFHCSAGIRVFQSVHIGGFLYRTDETESTTAWNCPFCAARRFNGRHWPVGPLSACTEESSLCLIRFFSSRKKARQVCRHQCTRCTYSGSWAAICSSQWLRLRPSSPASQGHARQGWTVGQSFTPTGCLDFSSFSADARMLSRHRRGVHHLNRYG